MRQLSIAAIALVFSTGCAMIPQTVERPPVTTDSGTGITIWKVPILGLGSWGIFGGYSGPTIVNNYSYQAIPPPVTPGSNMPVGPPGPPLPVLYQTLYPTRPFSDPTLVVFRNGSERAMLRLSIDGNQEEIVLQPGEATPDIHLDIGDHNVRVRAEVPTALGMRRAPDQFLVFRIHPRGTAQIVYLYE